ncbi:MAG: hypothetical protein EHM80_08355 [Nitrospiraceae bacterium]|nr:MAG: hypothetical protein EHM80_08355 [Nitrospiraceae bacterium]
MAEDNVDQPIFNEEELLRKGLEFNGRLKTSLPPRIDPATISTRAKIPFKALCIREVILYRVSELADAALACYQRDQLVVAATLTRALLESVALLYWLFNELQAAVAAEDTSKIDEFLGRALVGARNEATPLLAHNVMNAIDIVTKDIDHYRKVYVELCEIAHPNWGGGLGAYAKLNREKVWYEFGTSQLPKPLILGPLVTSLEYFIEFYDGMIPHLKEFAALCERELERPPSGAADGAPGEK